MAKVYIISSGCYSDWSIKKIFLDKEKAQAYHDVCDDYDLNDIAEYDASDDEIIIPLHYCYIEYYVIDRNSFYGNRLCGDYEFEIKHTNTNDSTIEHCNDTSYYDGILMLERYIEDEIFDEDKLKNKYLKVCQDLSAFIRDQIGNGASEDDIEKLLKNKN